MTVTAVREAYAEGGLEKVLKRQKPDLEYVHSLNGDAQTHLIALAWSDARAGYDRWTLRLQRDRFVKLELVESVSHETIRTTLKK
ncbi:MAG: helix-turn-helix domain-containing protein [Anaerolineaceae bacterium]